MIKTVFATIAIATLALSTSAFAITIVNRDSTENTVTVDKGATEVVHKIAPGANVTEPCPDVCGVRVADGTGSDFLAKDGAKLSVKDRKVTPDK